MRAIKTLAILAIATLALVSCQKEDNPFAKAENQIYPASEVPQLNLQQQLSYGSEAVSQSIQLPGTFLFGAFPDKSGIVSATCQANNVSFNIDKNKDGKVDDTRYYTRDMEFYINVVGKESLSIDYITFEGYGTFRYPIHIRQIGEDGTRTMNDSQLAEWKSSGIKPYRDYLVGKLTEVGTTYAYPGSITESEPYIRGEKIVDQSLIECRDLTVKTEGGATVKVRLQELRRDGMVGAFSGKAGDDVSIWLERAVYNQNSDIITNINVLDVYVD